MTSHRAALMAGASVAVLTGVASVVAWQSSSPVRARAGGAPTDATAWGFAAVLAAAFALYACGLWLLRRGDARVAAAVVVAAAVQTIPVAAPLLLSTDAWTYWAYGWTAARGGESPYTVPPADVPGNPAVPWMGAAWRDATSVYGPAFTLASEPLAITAGDSETIAAWQYKGLAAAAAFAAALLAARVARRRALAVAFVGWNPLLAVHLAGGGHNDAWVGALLMAALALASSRRPRASGAAWSLAVLVKWVPVVFLFLHAIHLRSRRRALPTAGVVAATAAVLAVATVRYGLSWVNALEPLAENAARETSYAIPSRLEQVGVPRAVALGAAVVALAGGLAWLSVAARRGPARLGLAACLLLVTTPYLAVWYLGWAVPLAAADEDRAARIGCLVLGAYLLPQTIPL